MLRGDTLLASRTGARGDPRKYEGHVHHVNQLDVHLKVNRRVQRMSVRRCEGPVVLKQSRLDL